jgi:hypothetical protein
MDYSKIEQVLEKYWNGGSSLEEEQQLYSFFAQENIPEHLKEYQDYFNSINGIRDLKLDDSFDQEILEIIENKETKKSKTKVVSFYGNKKYWISIAASMFIVFSLGYHFISPPPQVEDTYENPEEAFALLKESLLGISTNLNTGKEHSMKLIKFEQARQKITQ